METKQLDHILSLVKLCFMHATFIVRIPSGVGRENKFRMNEFSLSRKTSITTTKNRKNKIIDRSNVLTFIHQSLSRCLLANLQKVHVKIIFTCFCKCCRRCHPRGWSWLGVWLLLKVLPGGVSLPPRIVVDPKFTPS